jgi:hypothetical protein
MGITQRLGTIPLAIQTDASNNVGIGAAPSGSYKLEVTGTGRFTGGITAQTGEFLSAGQDGSTGSVVRIGTTNTNAAARNWGIVNSWDNYGDLTFRVSNAQGGNALSAGSTKMVILSSGNVGIGTTSPSYKFHVSNNTNGFISRFTGGTSSDVNIGIFGSTAGAFGSIGTESNHPFNIFTNGTDRLTITSGGNVGIGTTAPSIKLSVAQDITNDGDIANGQFMVCGATTNLKRMVLGYDTNGEGYGYIESAYKDSAWTYIALQPTSGNVIIGSSAIPSYKLQVNGSAAKPGGGSWSDSSDARLKKDIKTIENALDKINKLNPVNFEWINPEEHHNQNNISGFIAQEIKEVFPDFINEVNPVGKDKDIVGENEKIYALTLSFKFDAYLVKAIQELCQQNKELNERLNKAGL